MLDDLYNSRIILECCTAIENLPVNWEVYLYYHFTLASQRLLKSESVNMKTSTQNASASHKVDYKNSFISSPLKVMESTVEFS